jgi:hypothetical protein
MDILVWLEPDGKAHACLMSKPGQHNAQDDRYIMRHVLGHRFPYTFVALDDMKPTPPATKEAK